MAAPRLVVAIRRAAGRAPGGPDRRRAEAGWRERRGESGGGFPVPAREGRGRAGASMAARPFLLGERQRLGPLRRARVVTVARDTLSGILAGDGVPARPVGVRRAVGSSGKRLPKRWATQPGPRGRFTLVHTSDGFYLRAPRGGGGEVDATAPRATPWARFTARRCRAGERPRQNAVQSLLDVVGYIVVYPSIRISP